MSNKRFKIPTLHRFYFIFLRMLVCLALDENALDYACSLLCRPGTTHVHVSLSVFATDDRSRVGLQKCVIGWNWADQKYLHGVLSVIRLKRENTQHVIVNPVSRRFVSGRKILRFENRALGFEFCGVFGI